MAINSTAEENIPIQYPRPGAMNIHKIDNYAYRGWPMTSDR